ncbi:MAG: hypothetical protein JWP51_3061, partial [Bradyrhizobium sp.]|nr:hypothetical protein [Bradyrhizobium sp.]
MSLSEATLSRARDATAIRSEDARDLIDAAEQLAAS